MVPGAAKSALSPVDTGTASALPGALVSILNHPEFGQTLTQTDGTFALAVNGGALLTLSFNRSGFPPVQRQVQVSWQDWVNVPDVVLTPYDPNVTQLDLSQPTQVARGSTITDARGSRTATLLFSQGTSITLKLADGSTQALTTPPHVRATEFTAGVNGPNAMPGELPPASAYTYCVDFSLDEAVAAGATSVVFSQPVISYNENFLGFPTGSVVPVGFYDTAKASWTAVRNGVVVKILSTDGGIATLDVDGSGQPANWVTLFVLGISDAERQALATLYPAGQSLWRVSADHFSPYDFNWPYPIDAVPPNVTALGNGDLDTSETHEGTGCGTIEMENQILGNDVGITGSSFSLHYQTDRVPGLGNRTVRLEVIGDTVPESLKCIEVQTNVAGTIDFQRFPQPQPHQAYTYRWNGKDGFGNLVQGAKTANVQIAYMYKIPYAEPGNFNTSFGRFGGAPRVRVGPDVGLLQRIQVQLGTMDARSLFIGGWSLSAHHSYDPGGKVLHLGDGRRRSVQGADHAVITTVAGNGEPPSSPCQGDGGPANAAPVGLGIGKLAFLPDGSYVFTTKNDFVPYTQHLIRRVTPDGIIHTLAGGSPWSHEDGIPAKTASIEGSMLAVGPNGSVLCQSDTRIRQVIPDFTAPDPWSNCTIRTYAGVSSKSGHSGDGGPALSGWIDRSEYGGMTIANDGGLYFSDGFRLPGFIGKVDPTGILTYWKAHSGLYFPEAIAAGVNGDLYAGSCYWGAGVYKMGPDGAWTQLNSIATNDLAVDREGGVYASDGPQVYAVAPDGTKARVVAGNSSDSGYNGDSIPAISAQLKGVGGLTVGPDGCLYISDRGRIRRISSSLPGFTASDIAIPSEDGSILYKFDQYGQHKQTMNALTGAVLLQFGYDARGLLISATDANGNMLTIERTAEGNASAIVAAGGQRTVLVVNDNGYLTGATNPAGETRRYSYTNDGLMLTDADPKGNVSTYTYDTAGRLTKAEDPAGGSVTLARTETKTTSAISATYALGETCSYETRYHQNGDVKHTTTAPTGAKNVTMRKADGSVSTTLADGTTVAQVYGPDPRFGMLVPILTSRTVTMPSGLKSLTTASRVATLSDPANVFSITSLVDSVTTNGRTHTANYDGATRTVTVVSPAGRSRTATTDNVGRIVSATPDPAIIPITYDYDGQGRLVKMAQGNTSTSYTYDTLNRLTSFTDAAGHQVQYLAYDGADRAVRVKSPEGRISQTTYDKNGNLSAVTLPDGAVHTLDYTPVDLLSSHTLPGGSSYSSTYNPDEEPTSSTLPGGRTTTLSYDGAHRPTGTIFPEGSTTISYTDATSRIASCWRAPAEGGAPQSESFSYDGGLITKYAASGSANGQYLYRFDKNFFMTGRTLDALPEQAFTRDSDGSVTQYGPFTLTRSGPGGAVSQTTDGTATVGYTYDSLGRLQTRTHSTASGQVYRLQLAYDNAGRICQKTETVAGTAHTFTFTYDGDGELTQVQRDGAPFEAYAYDVNGNRTNCQSGAHPAQIAIYEHQDRLVSLGSTSYQFDADGFLSRRGSDTFRYSSRGELLTAVVDGQTITYCYDAAGRLTSRTDGAGTWQYLYDSPTSPLPSAIKDPSSRTWIFYYDSSGALYAFDRGENRYYVGCDQVGTPKIIVDSNGTTVKAMEYDSFGNLRADSAPEFSLPIGFGGGIADPVTGLVRFGARDYDPAGGRWTARDPILFAGGQGNFYVYVGSDPVGMVDRSGLCAYAWYKPWTWSPRAQKSAQAVGDFLLGSAMLVVGTGEEFGGGAFAVATAGAGAPVTVVAVGQGVGLQVAGGAYIAKSLLGAQQAVNMSGDTESSANINKGSTLPRDLREQLAIEQAQSNPAAGKEMPFQMSDPRWPASDGWVKMQQLIDSGSGNTNVHYVYNKATGSTADFKIKF